MKNNSTSLNIHERRKENELGEIICIREINENIKRVFNKKPLTRPLRVLNKNCEFKKRYDIACDLLEGDLKKERVRAYHKTYNQKPEVKERVRAYSQKPEVKERVRAYHKTYNQKPEVKERVRAYYKKNRKIILKKLKEINK